MEDVAAVAANRQTATNIERYFSSFTLSPGLIKILGAVTVGSFFGFGVRSAVRHTRSSEAAQIRGTQIISGVGLATRALAVATVITVSGFGLFILTVSTIFNVNTPRQFGDKMKNLCGDKLRLDQKESIPSFRHVLGNTETQSSPSTSSSA